MLIGYARTSTLDQKAGLEAQRRDLTSARCEKIFEEQVSSVNVEQRVKLDAAIDFCRAGDVLVVTKLDRLARSVAHLVTITETLAEKGVALRILDGAIDTGTPNGRLMLNMLASIAQFEREIMLERQREGIAKAKADGKYKGRKATAMARADEVKKLADEGMPSLKIAETLGIGKSSVYRILR
ncbi:Site-specific DNA recombinase [Poseidonocella pacifica]|uniref:Site-specific DNA recombinase n=1 Tax=Poseidonocella pacifica TaxID=871651 RepID=A0A1I0X835_9RHOB|nr:recombinase family protein [Poseidonocella pacifica]SFA96520.1 Site-specific DNA recombinase [Poseidonocella pacifica]